MTLTQQACSLVSAIAMRKREDQIPVIAEIKVRSPKAGDLLRGRDPVRLAQRMCACPIAGLSVVTEPTHFGGSLDLLRDISDAVSVPIMRKDYYRTPRDIEETKEAGADVVALNLSLLADETISSLGKAAIQSRIELLLAVHSTEETRRVARLNVRPDLIGINNRDIKVQETDDGNLSHTESLIPFLSKGVPIISESSILDAADARRARAAGADAILVGTSILIADDLERTIHTLVKPDKQQ